MNHLSMCSLVIFTLLLMSCGGKSNNELIKQPKDGGLDQVLIIPTVVHVLYLDEYPESNISDEKIKSQFIVLNQDFRALNLDLANVPAEFTEFIADVGIEFQLASLDPEGNETTGITRTLDQTTEAEGRYFDNSGGKDAWPSDQYLNIWVVDRSDRLGNVGAPGHAQFPGGDPLTDGLVIAYQAFGTTEPLLDTLRYGRTVTHEIGHWLNLKHIFGKKGSCEESDLVDDTPTSKNEYSGNPTHPASSCGSLDMFMNFMDYSSDESLLMFTKGQKKRMHEVFTEGGGRHALYLNITGH